MNLDKSIGSKIQKKRKSKNISQQELATRLQISRQHMSNVELGVKRPSLEILIELCDILNISLDSLLLNDNVEIIDESVSKRIQALLQDSSLYEKQVLLDVSKQLKMSLKENKHLLD